MDPFPTRLNYRILNSVSPFQDPKVIARDAILYSWDNKDLYPFPPIPLIRKVINKLLASKNTRLILTAPYWLQKEWFPDWLEVLMETP